MPRHLIILKSKKINTLDAVQAFVRFENEAIATLNLVDLSKLLSNFYRFILR